MIKRVTAKLGSMRKPQDFIVYPEDATKPETLKVQSDKSIGCFDKTTGKGILNTKGCYFVHLALGKPFDFPMDFVNQCIEAQPKSGDRIGGGIIIA